MSSRIYFGFWGNRISELSMPAYAVRRVECATDADAVYDAIARKNGLHVCGGPRSEGISLMDRGRHYAATLGRRCRGGGYTPVAEVWISIPA